MTSIFGGDSDKYRYLYFAYIDNLLWENIMASLRPRIGLDWLKPLRTFYSFGHSDWLAGRYWHITSVSLI